MTLRKDLIRLAQEDPGYRSRILTLFAGEIDAPNYREVSQGEVMRCANCRFALVNNHCSLFHFTFQPDRTCDDWAAVVGDAALATPSLYSAMVNVRRGHQGDHGRSRNPREGLTVTIVQ